MTKKILTFLLLGIFLIGFASAIQSDSFIKDQDKIDELNTKTNYGIYIIEERTWWDLFGWWTEKNIKEVTLKDNSDTCGEDCYAIKTINNLEEGSLIDDVRFYRIYEDGSQKLSNIRSYNFYIKTDEEEYSVDDYEYKCVDLKEIWNEKNQTFYTPQSCSNVVVGSHIEKEPLWISYTLGETKPIGTYEVKLVGEKRPSWSYDWQVLIGDTNTWTDEWATWGNISTGDDSEVILNSPENNKIIYIYNSLVNFNATANVTGGATIINISLWTNETGSWDIRNTTENSFEDEIHYYKLDEASGVLVDSSGNSNGTNTGMLYGETGKINKAVKADTNTDVINFIDESNWQQTTNYSANIWYKGTTTNHILFSNFINDGVNNYGWGLKIENPDPYVGIIHGNGATVISGTLSTTSIADGEWHMITSTYDGTTARLYIDGISEANDTLSAPIYTATNRPNLNAYYYNNGAGYEAAQPATYDEVRFWNRTLTKDEISELYDYTGTTKTQTWDRTITNDIIWNVQACDSDGDCGFSITNRTIKKSDLFENNRTSNLTSYETARETYQIDLTANSSLTAVTLDYNGTDYAATQSGNIWSYSMDVPSTNIGNNSIDWKFTYGGNTINSNSTSYQDVSEIVFTLCNTTYTDDFLNITFKDEADLSSINASIPTSTFTYYLGSGTVTKEYDYINNTDNFNYLFCGTPSKTFHVEPYIQYKRDSDYPQRIWNPSVLDYTSSLSTQVLYLLESVDGIYVTIQVDNSASQLISGVYINATREISGTDTIVAAGTTGSDGTVTFWLNPDFSHDFTLTKAGYTDYSTTFTPTQTSYTITLGDTAVTENSTIRGIDYSIIPTDSYLVNDTSYTFGFTLTSSYWDVDDYGFTLRLSNGTKIDGGNTGVEGTALTEIYNVNNQTIIYLDYYWYLNGIYSNGSRYWVVQNTELTGWSIANFFTDLDLYLDSGIYGLDDFGRSLIIFLILFVSVGIMSYKYGAKSPLAISSLIFGIIFFFDVVVGLIPTIRGITYLPTFLAFLVLTLAIFNEVRT